LAIVEKFKKRIEKCECENNKLSCLVRESKEEIERLNKQVKYLICQNKKNYMKKILISKNNWLKHYQPLNVYVINTTL